MKAYFGFGQFDPVIQMVILPVITFSDCHFNNENHRYVELEVYGNFIEQKSKYF